MASHLFPAQAENWDVATEFPQFYPHFCTLSWLVVLRKNDSLAEHEGRVAARNTWIGYEMDRA